MFCYADSCVNGEATMRPQRMWYYTTHQTYMLCRLIFRFVWNERTDKVFSSFQFYQWLCQPKLFRKFTSQYTHMKFENKLDKIHIRNVEIKLCAVAIPIELLRADDINFQLVVLTHTHTQHRLHFKFAIETISKVFHSLFLSISRPLHTNEFDHFFVFAIIISDEEIQNVLQVHRKTYGVVRILLIELHGFDACCKVDWKKEREREHILLLKWNKLLKANTCHAEIINVTYMLI